MKRIIAIAIALVMCLSIAACSPNDETTDPIVTTAPTEPTEPPTEPTEPPTKPTEPSTAPTEPSTQPAEPQGKRILTVYAPDAWTEVYVYTWDPEEFGTFPGIKLTKSGDVYKTEIKSTMSNLVIIGKKADTTLQQTADITLGTNNNSVKIEVFEDGTHEIKVPTIDRFVVTGAPVATKTTGTASVYRIVGGGATDANGKEMYNGAWLGSWVPDWDGGLMYEVEPGLYRKNFENVQPGKYEFKITKDGGWDVSYGDGEKGNQNCKFFIEHECTITVDFKIEEGIGYIKLYSNIISVDV